jgi:hypothetical protein
MKTAKAKRGKKSDKPPIAHPAKTQRKRAKKARDAKAALTQAVVRGFLRDGLPMATLTVAEFVRRGQAAQQAVDAILAAERSKRKS